MEGPRTLDPTESKQAFSHLNGTDSPRLIAFEYINSFTFFDNFQTQRLRETKNYFRKNKTNIFHYGAFASITNSQLVFIATLNEKAVCWGRYEFIMEKDGWTSIV